MSSVYGTFTPIQKFDTFSSLSSFVGNDGDVAWCADVRLTFIYSAANAGWQPSNRLVVKKSNVTVTATSTGPTLIYTLEQAGGFNFYPSLVIPRVVNVSGVSTAPAVALGTNASSYNNIATASLLSSALATLGANGGAPQTANFSPALAAGAAIYANVTTAAIATAYQVKYDIIGFYDV